MIEMNERESGFSEYFNIAVISAYRDRINQLYSFPDFDT
jgi:hypothetical protein